jgi:hypothetical protein
MPVPLLVALTVAYLPISLVPQIVALEAALPLLLRYRQVAHAPGCECCSVVRFDLIMCEGGTNATESRELETC